jgi:16S rRNA (cytosine967-C5)-methyltransferase
MTDGVSSRVSAVRVIAAVIGKGQTLEGALLAARPSLADRAMVQSLVFGVLRFGHRLSRVATALVSRSWDSQTPELRALLLLGLYQLEYSGTPPHAAVNTIVAAARLVGEQKAAGMVNACLRRFQRERARLLDLADETLAGRTSHPIWLVEAYQRDWPAYAVPMLAAANEHPPLTLRTNVRKGSVEALAAELAADGHVTMRAPGAPDALILETPIDVRGLPAFIEGRCSVQDAAAQCAVPLLAAQAGMRVLDACAAPGGKTGHLLEATPGLTEVVALDIDQGRAGRIQENLTRLGLEATILVGDATDPSLLLGQRFDRILIDAPCSGTGVVRRHPDIKWLRRPGDLQALADRQLALLAALWPLLAPGGRLLYATCSLLKSENRQVIRAFFRQFPDAIDVTESASLTIGGMAHTELTDGPGIALLPGMTAVDGFYYACLEHRCD